MDSLQGLTDIGVIAMAMVIVIKEIFSFFKSSNVATAIQKQNDTLNELVTQIRILVEKHSK